MIIQATLYLNRLFVGPDFPFSFREAEFERLTFKYALGVVKYGLGLARKVDSIGPKPPQNGG